MPSAALTLPLASTGTLTRNLRIFANEIRFEFIRSLRTRSFSLSSIGFPVMFYVLFALVMNRDAVTHGVNVGKYMLGGYAVFGMVGSALFGIGVGMASEIGAGWLELKRASPMPPIAYLLAKCVTAMGFGVIIVSILCALAISFGHVSLSASEYARMLALTIFGAVPFASMGLLLALLVPFNATPAIVNLIYLPMSFLSGLWIPVFLLPHWLQVIAPWLPTYHLAQLMQSVFGYQSPNSSPAAHVFALIGFTLIMLGIATIAFQRREQSA